MLDAAAREERRRCGLRLEPPPVSSLAQDRTARGVPVRVFTPPAPRGAFLHVHGGGFVYGSSRLQDDRLESLATACSLVVVSVEYRLAPEHSQPAALDDCEAAALWLAEGLGKSFLAVGGESAGANLAVGTLRRLRGRVAFDAAVLVAGLYDLTLAQMGDGDPALTRDELEHLVAGYAAGASRTEPELSPVLADLVGVPPALIVVGSRDPLLADSVRLAERWGAAATLVVVDGAPHSLDPGDLAHAYLRERLG